MKTSHLKRKLALAALCISLTVFLCSGAQPEHDISDLAKPAFISRNNDLTDEDQPAKFLVNTYASKGLCKVTTSPGRAGNPYSLLFDGNTSAPWVSAEVNPAFVQIAFDDYVELDKIRILPGEPGYPGINKNDWWVETADTQNDLDSKTGSYNLLIPKRTDIAGVWDEVVFPSAVKNKIVKFYVQRTIYDNYVHIPEIELWGTPPSLETTPGDKFLIVVSSPLFNTGVINDALNDYIADVQKEGWQTELITVNSAPDTTADYFTPSEVELKAVIKSFYNQGFDGFVFIGSDPDIPTAYWKHHKNMREYGYTNDPCDLFYADMDVWVDLDDNGIYETWDSKWDAAANNWAPDYSKPANPSNPHFFPEMFYGRISARPIVANLAEEAQKVKFYLDKLHQYRMNGSRLSPERQKSAMTYVADEYFGVPGPAYVQSANYIYKNHGIMLCGPATLKRELERGYKFASIITHSGNDAHAIFKWEDGKRTFAGFNLYDWDNTDAKVHYVNFFACYAAKFTVPNFGAHILFNNSYALNVTGSSGGWGIILDEDCGRDINMNLPVGVMLKNYMLRSTGEEGWPKGILHGDPLVRYSNFISNRPPVFNDHMEYFEASMGETFSYYISVSDPDGDAVTVTSDNLPANASINDGLLTFTPSADQVDKTFPINLIAKDPHNNTYTAEITIYVNSFKNDALTNNTNIRGWTTSGNVAITPYTVPPFHKRAIVLRTISGNASITQKALVSQNSGYKMVFWINKNELIQNSQNMYWRIDELNQNYPVVQNLNYGVHYDPYIYGEVSFNSGNNSALTFSFHSGNASSPTSGVVYLTGMRLVNRGICDPAPDGINGDFAAGCEGEPYNWTQESFRANDAVFKWEESGGINNSKCISIDHDNVLNDSRWQQNITGLIPGAEYTLKCLVRGENIQSSNASFVGANLNINLNNTWNNTPGLSGTFDWKEMSLAFKAPSSGNITIQCRLGHFGSIVTGKAWFDNVTLNTTANPLIVNAKGSAAGGIYAHFKVFVDGSQIGNAFTSSSYQPYTFPLPYYPVAVRQVEIVFDNDAVINGQDRNLFVQSIELGGEVIPAGRENVVYTKNNGSVVAYSTAMWWGGKLLFKIPRPQISVTAKGTQAGGTYAHFRVFVNDTEIGNSYTTSTYQQYDFPSPVSYSGIGEIKVVYDNDAVINGRDRNLYVQSIAIDEEVIPATKENVVYTRNNGTTITYYGGMWWNGDLVFHINNSASRLAAEIRERNALPQEEQVFDAVVFPNPNEGKFYLKFGKACASPVELVLLDISGKVLAKEILPAVYEGEIKDFNMLSVGKGIYFISLINNEISLTKKVSIR